MCLAAVLLSVEDRNVAGAACAGPSVRLAGSGNGVPGGGALILLMLWSVSQKVIYLWREGEECRTGEACSHALCERTPDLVVQ